MDENKEKQFGKWACNTCGTVKGVTNGLCPKCGPTQTTPQDESAKILAGVVENEEQE